MRKIKSNYLGWAGKYGEKLETNNEYEMRLVEVNKIIDAEEQANTVTRPKELSNKDSTAFLLSITRYITYIHQ